jgi:hypothetical protein
MRSRGRDFSQSGLSSRAIDAVIEKGIKGPIQLLMDAHCYPAVLVLTYSGMDTMSFLNMPRNRSDVMRSDFIAWAGRYVKIALPNAPAGSDLYGMRCSVLHGGAPSRFTREGRGRPIRHAVATANGADAVAVTELVSAFFSGIDQFLMDLASDASKAELAGRRLEELQASGLYEDSPNIVF